MRQFNTNFYRTCCIVLLGFLLSSCRKISADHHTENLLKDQVSKNIGGTLEFGKITNFKWNRMLILRPYTNISWVEKDLAINLEAIEHSGINHRDDINQIVFFDGDRAVSNIEFPRIDGDFKRILKPVFYTKEEAVFSIVANSGHSANKRLLLLLKKER